MMSPEETPTPRPTWPEIVLVLGGCVALSLALMRFLVPGWDLVTYFAPVPRLWLDGETRLYDEGVPAGFPYPPWFLLVILPLAWIPLRAGQLILFALSFGAVYSGAWIFARRGARVDLLPLPLLIGSLHFLQLLYLGQVDGLILLGVIAGWLAIQARRPALFAAALVILSTKPVNVALVLALYLIVVMRRWSWREQAIAVWGPALIVAAISALISGADWPLRYAEHFGQEGKPGIMRLSIWELGLPATLAGLISAGLLAAWGWAVWRAGLTRWTLALSLTTMLLISPYVMGYHFVLLTPAYAHLWARDRRLAVGIGLLMFTGLLRASGDAWNRAAIDALYPAALWIALWWGPERRARTHLPASMRNSCLYPKRRALSIQRSQRGRST